MDYFTDYEFEERLEVIQKLYKSHWTHMLHAERMMNELKGFLLTCSDRDPTLMQNRFDEVKHEISTQVKR